MHGIIHSELKKFVETKHGANAWKAVLQEAGFENKVYLSNTVYADEEAIAIVTAASRLTGTPPEDILENFGEFIVPALMSTFRPMTKSTWKTMDLLLNTEETIHKAVRIKNPGAQPPRLKFKQTGPNTLRFNYNSWRRMSSVAKGIIKGVAKYYGETVDIQERKGPGGSSEMDITIN
ncbi:MAG: heme NO-binding domain-containing protein [Rhizobiales bacterium]|nr:heme NO-binding domain-containing protein [Hyphomicrobiales bacterium]